jgi:putative membrane protein
MHWFSDIEFNLKMVNVATEGTLNQSMDKAKRHYSSLFFLPSLSTSLGIIAAICIVTGTLITVTFKVNILPTGLILGASLFLATLVVDLALSQVVLRDPIFVLRRVSVLSLFSWVFWFILIIVGVCLAAAFGSVWSQKLCLLGFGTLLTLRTVVMVTVSSAGFGRRLLGVVLQPFACIVPFAAFWATQNVSAMGYVPFIIVAPFIAVPSAYFFIRQLDKIGKQTYSVPSIDIFRAFMLNWVAALNSPLEAFLEKMGADADIEVSLLKFDAAKPKAAVVVPLVHPGPFKNIGSSLLPSLLKKEYDSKFGCQTCIPLGLLGHESDAASQAQNQKIIHQVIGAASFPASDPKATGFVRVSEGNVAASCQIFGKTAFLSFTLAPKTTEDLPAELGGVVREEAAKLSLDAVVVNAHNSLTENTQVEASLDELRDVAVKCLRKSAAQKVFEFEVGAATDHPAEFSLKDGLADGGITAITVKVGEQKTAYVVIDGNNMVSGLREEILAAIASIGFQEIEVFTTDTHAVSAVVVGQRGYHPVGEAMNHMRLIEHIKSAVLAAAKNMEPCKAGHLKLVVPKVRVIGVEFLNSVSTLVDQTIQKAKRILLPIFGAEHLLLIVILIFL